MFLALLVHVDFAVAFQLFCIVQGLTTTVYLLSTSTRQPANKWLGLLLLGLTLQVMDYFLAGSGVYFRNRWLYFTPLFFSWSFGPLALSYLRVYFGQPPLRWPHFGPVMLQASFYSLVCLQSFDAKTAFWLSVHKPFTRYVEHYGSVVSVTVYLLLAHRLVRQHHPSSWWQRGLLAMGIFYGAAALDPLVNAWYLPAGAPKFYLTSVALPVLAYGLALLAWLRSRTIGIPLTVAKTGADSTWKKPAGPVDTVQLQRVIAALEQEALFKDPELTLTGLAQQVNLASAVVSQLLNSGRGQSFSDVVNGYRLEEVKRRLLTPDASRLTLLALALEAGFNSKATFNRVFKEKVGITPKEYQKKYQITN